MCFATRPLAKRAVGATQRFTLAARAAIYETVTSRSVPSCNTALVPQRSLTTANRKRAYKLGSSFKYTDHKGLPRLAKDISLAFLVAKNSDQSVDKSCINGMATRLQYSAAKISKVDIVEKGGKG